MDNLKIINDLISEKMKRNISMVEFHKRQVEKYESIIQELDELRDDLEFELDCEDQNYRYNNQTERFEKISPMKEYKNTFRSLTSLGEEDCDDDDCTPDLFRDEFDDEEEDIHKLKLGDDCLYCDDGWIEMVDDGMRKIFRCPECDYMYSWRDVEYD